MFQVYSKVIQLYRYIHIYLHIFFFRFFSTVGYYKVLNIVPYVIQVEKALAPHSSTLAWKIPWAEETGRLQSMGSQRV